MRLTRLGLYEVSDVHAESHPVFEECFVYVNFSVDECRIFHVNLYGAVTVVSAADKQDADFDDADQSGNYFSAVHLQFEVRCVYSGQFSNHAEGPGYLRVERAINEIEFMIKQILESPLTPFIIKNHWI